MSFLKIYNIVKSVVDTPKLTVTNIKDDCIAVYAGFVHPSHLEVWAEELKKHIPNAAIYVGRSGIVDNRIVIKFKTN
jgi:hypothetical protein